jgi:hypothetical protein
MKLSQRGRNVHGERATQAGAAPVRRFRSLTLAWNDELSGDRITFELEGDPGLLGDLDREGFEVLAEHDRGSGERTPETTGTVRSSRPSGSGGRSAPPPTGRGGSRVEVRVSSLSRGSLP